MWGCCYFLSNEFGELYVGSTIDWKERIKLHKRRKVINMDCLWYWDYFEEGEYENLEELRKKEKEYIHKYKDCIVNKTKYKGKKVCDREGYLKHKEARDEKMKNWRDNNKDKIRERNRKYNESRKIK